MFDDDGVTIVRLEGDVEFLVVPALTSLLQKGVQEARHGLAVDLTKVRYLDSAGIHMLFQVAEELTVARKVLGLVVPEGSQIRTVLRITNFDEVATIHTSLSHCTESLRNGEFLHY